MDERFDSKWTPEPNSGCHLWIGAVTPAGYGEFSLNKKPHYAHRLSWQRHRGEIPKGMCVLHRCDTPSCVNPDHLFLGTRGDNIHDAILKNRHCKGEDQHMAKLKEADIPKILSDTRSQSQIAKDYGVVRTTIEHVKTRKNWRHVK